VEEIRVDIIKDEDLNEILEKLVDKVKSGDYLSGALIVMVALIFNFKKIVDFLEDRKKARLLKLTEALECEHVRGLSKSHLEEELATEYFKIVTGIRLEKEFREAIIKAHRDTKGEINFTHFKRALPHIIFNDSKLSVNISIFEWVGYAFNFCCGFLLALLGFLIIQANQINAESIFQIINRLGFGSFFIIIGFLMLYSTSPLLSARKVKKSLKSN